MIKLYLSLLCLTRVLQRSQNTLVNLAPKLQLAKMPLTGETMPNENGHGPTCAGSSISQLAYLLLSKHELALEYIKMKEHLAKVQTGEYCEHSLGTCLDFKGCLIRLGCHFQTLPEPCVTQEGHSLPQERSRVQASLLALAGLCLPALGQSVPAASPVCTSPCAQARAE